MIIKQIKQKYQNKKRLSNIKQNWKKTNLLITQ